MLQDDIRELLRNRDARILAFDPHGATVLPVPADFLTAPGRVTGGRHPLSGVDPATQGRVVAAFERARRHGRAGTTLRLVDDTADQPVIRRLEIFDAMADYGCFLSVSWPIVDGRDETASGAALTPLRAVFEVNATGVVESVSDEFTAMLGWTDAQLVGSSSLDLIHPDEHEAGIVSWIELLENPDNQVRVLRRYRTNRGEWMWCEVTLHNRLADRNRPTVEVELVDVSREMAAQAALQRRETLLDRLSQAHPSGVLYLDHTGSPAQHNERWRELTGLDQAASTGSIGLEPLLARIEEADAVVEALARRRVTASMPISRSPSSRSRRTLRPPSRAAVSRAGSVAFTYGHFVRATNTSDCS